MRVDAVMKLRLRADVADEDVVWSSGMVCLFELFELFL
jgi:hypothetical protein